MEKNIKKQHIHIVTVSENFLVGEEKKVRDANGGKLVTVSKGQNETCIR